MNAETETAIQNLSKAFADTSDLTGCFDRIQLEVNDTAIEQNHPLRLALPVSVDARQLDPIDNGAFGKTDFRPPRSAYRSVLAPGDRTLDWSSTFPLGSSSFFKKSSIVILTSPCARPASSRSSTEREPRDAPTRC